jgi:hypothetical protein
VRYDTRRGAVAAPFGYTGAERRSAMDETTTPELTSEELTDEDIRTVMPGVTDGPKAETDPDTMDKDGTDGDTTDGTDGDAADQDGTDGTDADGTDAADAAGDMDGTATSS